MLTLVLLVGVFSMGALDSGSELGGVVRAADPAVSGSGFACSSDANCGGHGTCTNGDCVCARGFSGAFCDEGSPVGGSGAATPANLEKVLASLKQQNPRAAAHKAAAPAQRKPASSPASAVTKSVSPAAASAAAATAPAEAPADKAAAVAKPALTEKEKEAKRKTDRAAKKKLRSATFEAETNAKQSSWQKFSSKKRRGISKVRNDGPR